MHDFPEITETTLEEVCSFWAEGDPVQQGSKIAMMPRGHKRPIVVESVSVALRAWRKHVNHIGQVEMIGKARVEKPDAAKVWVQFVMPRPATHRKTGPTRLCNVTPDLDKLGRAIGDALTGVCYGDDGLINAWHMEKRTAEAGEPTGVLITVYREMLPDAE
jgi:Holliday junction resolvase RusA-like endonuclease